MSNQNDEEMATQWFIYFVAACVIFMITSILIGILEVSI